jgi:hypothetical protein
MSDAFYPVYPTSSLDNLCTDDTVARRLPAGRVLPIDRKYEHSKGVIFRVCHDGRNMAELDLVNVPFGPES